MCAWKLIRNRSSGTVHLEWSRGTAQWGKHTEVGQALGNTSDRLNLWSGFGASLNVDVETMIQRGPVFSDGSHGGTMYGMDESEE